jgi:hypothetical protein
MRSRSTPRVNSIDAGCRDVVWLAPSQIVIAPGERIGPAEAEHAGVVHIELLSAEFPRRNAQTLG